MKLDKTRLGLGALLVSLSITSQRGAEAASPTAPPAPAASAAPAAPKASAPASPGAAVPVASLPAAPASAPAAGSPALSPMDGPTHAVRLRDLEVRIDELKEKIRHQHARISLLSDSILDGGEGAARVSLKFSSELSGALRVSRVLVVLDGAVYYNRTDPSGTSAEPFEVPVYDGPITPGDHTVQVLVNLQGDGHGVFSYLRGYRFEVRSSHSFTAIDGKTVNLEAVSYEKGTVTTPFDERPALRYREKIVAGVGDTAAQPAAPRAGAAPR